MINPSVQFISVIHKPVPCLRYIPGARTEKQGRMGQWISQTDRVWALVLPLTSCMCTGKLPNLPVPRFFTCKMKPQYTPHGVFGGPNEMMYIRCLA